MSQTICYDPPVNFLGCSPDIGQTHRNSCGWLLDTDVCGAEG